MTDTIFNDRLGDQYQRMIHSSGLEILLFPKKCVTTFATLVFRFGSQDTAFRMGNREHKVPDGTAHFLEHKLFARPDGTDANEAFSRVGAEANAWTSYDKTAYLFSTGEPCDEALRTLVTFVSEPYFTRENVARERGIIREEIAMGEDDPWARLYEQSMRATFVHHGVRRKICGTQTSVGRITHKTLQLCYDAFYRPQNAYLVVCGDLTMERVLSCVDEPLLLWHERMKDLPAVTKLAPDEPDRILHAHVIKQGGVVRPIWRITWKDTHVPATTEQQLWRETAMNFLSEMLFCRAARFYDGLFEAGHISPTYSYGYSAQGGLCPIAYHSVEGEADDPDRILRTYFDYIEQLRQTGLSREDFERMRRVLYAGYVSQFDFPDDIADMLCDCHGEGRGLFDPLTVLQNITFEEVEALFCDSFDPRATVFAVINPDPKTKED